MKRGNRVSTWRRRIATFIWILIAIIVASFCLNNYFLNSQIETNLEEQEKNMVRFELVKEMVVVNVGGLSRTSELVLVIPGYYENSFGMTPRYIASHKVSEEYDFMMAISKDGCTGLKENAEELAKFIDEYLSKEYKEIYVIGCSKGGLISIEMTNLLAAKNVSFANLDVPYAGAITATPWAVEERISMWTEWVQKEMRNVYYSNFANSVLDQQIAYNAEYLSTIDYSGVSKFRFVNAISTDNGKALIKDLWRFNSLGLGCIVLDKTLFIEGDGIVENRSKQVIDDYVSVKTLYGNNSHAGAYFWMASELIETLKKLPHPD